MKQRYLRIKKRKKEAGRPFPEDDKFPGTLVHVTKYLIGSQDIIFFEDKIGRIYNPHYAPDYHEEFNSLFPEVIDTEELFPDVELESSSESERSEDEIDDILEPSFQTAAESDNSFDQEASVVEDRLNQLEIRVRTVTTPLLTPNVSRAGTPLREFAPLPTSPLLQSVSTQPLPVEFYWLLIDQSPIEFIS